MLFRLPPEECGQGEVPEQIPSAALGPVQVCHEQQHPSSGEEAWGEQPSMEQDQNSRPLKHRCPAGICAQDFLAQNLPSTGERVVRPGGRAHVHIGLLALPPLHIQGLLSESPINTL